MEQFVDLAIRLDNLLRSPCPSQLAPIQMPTFAIAPESEPMHVGVTRLSSEERERRVQNHLCLYCELSGRANCPTRPSTKYTTAVSASPNILNVPISLTNTNVKVEMMALIDSGAVGNFIDINFANFHKLPFLPCEYRVAVAALDGCPLGTGLVKFTTQDLTLKVGSIHTEIIRLFAIDSPQNPVILGLPWWTDTTLVFPGPLNRFNNGQSAVKNNACNYSIESQPLHFPRHQKPQPCQTFQWNTKISLRRLASQRLLNFHHIDPVIVPLTCFLELCQQEAEYFPYHNLSLRL